jgi:hypothetical protein
MQDISRVWLEVKALNVHSICDKLLIPLSPFYIDQCIKMFMLILNTNQLLSTTQQVNQVHQVGLQLLKKRTKFYEKHGFMNACCNFFPSFFHILSNPKYTQKNVFGSHFGVMIYSLDVQAKFPPNPYRCNFLYASNSTTHTTFKRYQPLASTLDQS